MDLPDAVSSLEISVRSFLLEGLADLALCRGDEKVDMKLRGLSEESKRAPAARDVVHTLVSVAFAKLLHNADCVTLDVVVTACDCFWRLRSDQASRGIATSSIF